jgi:hypothetical protein
MDFAPNSGVWFFFKNTYPIRKFTIAVLLYWSLNFFSPKHLIPDFILHFDLRTNKTVGESIVSEIKCSRDQILGIKC